MFFAQVLVKTMGFGVQLFVPLTLVASFVRKLLLLCEQTQWIFEDWAMQTSIHKDSEIALSLWMC